MKTKSTLYLLAVSAAVLSLSAATGSGQLFDSVDALNNRAIAASPRALETFPWLARAPSPKVEVCCVEATIGNALAEARKNRAVAASPRTLEQFPELARAAEAPSARSAGTDQLSAVTKNHAFAASPRALEQFPQLARGKSTKGTGRAFEVAPLK